MAEKKIPVDIFIPCYVDQYFPQTAVNMVKVLERTGCKVHYNVEQTCCGLPAFQNGYWNHCKEVGIKLIREFQHERPIVIPGAACTNMIKNYYHEMFHNSMLHNEYKSIQKNIFEFSDFLVRQMKITDTQAKLHGIAVYHDACNALRDLKIKDAPGRLLSNVEGLVLKEMETEEAEICCGWGGSYACRNEKTAASLAKEKIEAILKTGADYIISNEPGCLMHLEGYIRKNNIQLKILHIADVLAGTE